MSKQMMQELVDQLIILGEDELSFWINIFDFLETDDQQQIIADLMSELNELSKFSQENT